MVFHFILACLLNFLFGVTAKPFASELYISNIETTSLNNQPLVDRSAQQDNSFSDFSNMGDISVFGDDPDMFSSTPEISGDDTALLNDEVYPLNQYSPGLDVYIKEPAASDAETLDMFAASSAELPTLCESGKDLDSFMSNPNTLTGRNLIDDFFDFRIPGEILAPNKLCPNPMETKKSPQSTEPTSKLPFRIPFPDFNGKRCRVGIGEVPSYALCCFLPEDGNKEHACYPGKVTFFSSSHFFCASRLSIYLPFIILHFRYSQPIIFYYSFCPM